MELLRVDDRCFAELARNQGVSFAELAQNRSVSFAELAQNRGNATENYIMVKVFFMRHGQTDMNVANKLQGQVDCPLNAVGLAQAEVAGDNFSRHGLTFDKVYSSPLSRAVNTAMRAAQIDIGDVVIDSRVIEMDFGPFEGAIYKDFDDDMWNWLKDPDHIPTPEGIEPIEHLNARTRDFVKSMHNEADGSNILVVSHGVAIRSILKGVYDLKGENRPEVWAMPIENCVLYKIEVSDDDITAPEKVEL